MPRIRTIKPEFWTNPQVARCPFPARLLFIGTWTFADDNGNLPRDAEKLKMQVFPSTHDADVDVESLIASLITHGLLTEYSVSPTEERFLHIPTFRKHQVINRPSKSAYPLPNKPQRPDEETGRDSGEQGIHGSLTEHSGTEGKRKGSGSGRDAEGNKTSGLKRTVAVNPRASEDENLPVRPAEISTAMRRHSIEASPADPRIIEAAEQGYAPATIEAACVEARAADPSGRITPGFVLAIAKRWQAEADRMRRPQARATTNGHGQKFDERSQDRKRAYQALTGHGGDEPPPDVIDVDATVVTHADPKH